MSAYWILALEHHFSARLRGFREHDLLLQYLELCWSIVVEQADGTVEFLELESRLRRCPIWSAVDFFALRLGEVLELNGQFAEAANTYLSAAAYLQQVDHYNDAKYCGLLITAYSNAGLAAKRAAAWQEAESIYFHTLKLLSDKKDDTSASHATFSFFYVFGKLIRLHSEWIGSTDLQRNAAAVMHGLLAATAKLIPSTAEKWHDSEAIVFVKQRFRKCKTALTLLTEVAQSGTPQKAYAVLLSAKNPKATVEEAPDEDAQKKLRMHKS